MVTLTNKFFNLAEGLSKAMTNYNFNVSHCNPKYQKIFYEFGKEMKVNIKQVGRKSLRDISLI